MPTKWLNLPENADSDDSLTVPQPLVSRPYILMTFGQVDKSKILTFSSNLYCCFLLFFLVENKNIPPRCTITFFSLLDSRLGDNFWTSIR